MSNQSEIFHVQNKSQLDNKLSEQEQFKMAFNVKRDQFRTEIRKDQIDNLIR